MSKEVDYHCLMMQMNKVKLLCLKWKDLMRILRKIKWSPLNSIFLNKKNKSKLTTMILLKTSLKKSQRSNKINQNNIHLNL